MAALSDVALSDVSFYLQPSNVAQPRIELSNVQTNTLGRSAKWHIKDPMISREQILMEVDRVHYPDTPVTMTHVGLRHSSVNGNAIMKSVKRIKVDDVIRFLYNSKEHEYTLQSNETPLIVVASPAKMVVPSPIIAGPITKAAAQGWQGFSFMLQPTDPTLPCIELSNDCNNILGRSSDPKWGITNPFVSRLHIGMAIHESEEKPVVMRQLGMQPSSVNDILVHREDPYCTELVVNDVLRFLSYDPATEYTIKLNTTNPPVIVEAPAPAPMNISPKNMLVRQIAVTPPVIVEAPALAPMNMSPKNMLVRQIALTSKNMCFLKHNISTTTLLQSNRVPAYPSGFNALRNARIELITFKHERNDLLLLMGVDRITVQHSSTKEKYFTSVGYNTLSAELLSSDLTLHCTCPAFLKNSSNKIAAILQGRNPIIDVSKLNHCKHTLVVVCLNFFSDPELHFFLQDTTS